MSSNEPKRKLVGPWQTIHGVIWVVGIYYLWSRGWWWPGILVLVGISALYEALLRSFVPEAYEVEEPEKVAEPDRAIPPIDDMASPGALQTNPTLDHHIELLPQECPSCSAPIRGHEVRWTGPQSANCPYCGTNLPMSKA